ncbi:MAG: recombinase family protein [Rhodopila sp.]
MAGTQPQARHLGYARVSTYGQTLEAQLAQLTAQECSKIYREQASGAPADRQFKEGCGTWIASLTENQSSPPPGHTRRIALCINRSNIA